MWKVAAVTLIAAGLVVGSPETAAAHHSHAMFDMSKELTITGTVTNYSYRNPHVFLHLDVKDQKGEVTSWAVEMSNISNMQSRGIYLSTFKPGDVVTVKINPLRDGRLGGNYTSVTAADGKIYQ
jgi:DNA/RNA endonuclease YhcR with UshA esterase domain